MTLQRARVVPAHGFWKVKADARQVVTAYETQSEATRAARSLLARSGGGELVVEDTDHHVILTESVPSFSSRPTLVTAPRP